MCEGGYVILSWPSRNGGARGSLWKLFVWVVNVLINLPGSGIDVPTDWVLWLDHGCMNDWWMRQCLVLSVPHNENSQRGPSGVYVFFLCTSMFLWVLHLPTTVQRYACSRMTEDSKREMAAMCEREWCVSHDGLGISNSSTVFLSVCYSLRVWAVCWLPPPPVRPQLQLEADRGSQGWCRSLQGSLCPQYLPSLLHLALAKRRPLQSPRSQTQAHMRSATVNVKVRNDKLLKYGSSSPM